MIQAIEGSCIVKPLRREKVGSIWVPDIGKPTTWGQVVSSGVQWLQRGDEVLHLPWARPCSEGATRLWILDERAIVAYRERDTLRKVINDPESIQGWHRPSRAWQMVDGWLLVEIDMPTEHQEGHLIVLDAKVNSDEAQTGTALTGPLTGRRVMWKVDNERVVTIRTAGREWQVIGQGQLLAVVADHTTGGRGLPPPVLPAVEGEGL